MVDRDPTGLDRPGERRNKWLPLLIGLAILIALILLLRSCMDNDDAADMATVDPAGTATLDTGAGAMAGGNAAAGAPVSWNNQEFTTYLGGQEPLGRSFALDRVTFASGSALLNADAKAQIGEVAAALKSRPSARVALRGYADPAGDAAANQALSEQRTNAVRNALVEAGATQAQVAAAAALGETGNTATQENRRVEITVVSR